MKLTVTKSRLEAAVKSLRRVINQKNSMPILADLLFDVNAQDLRACLTASDGETWMSDSIQLESCEGEGRFCVNAERLAAMLTEVSEQPVTIYATTESDNRFRIEYQEGEAFCPLEPADEYPMPRTPDANTILLMVNGDMLRRALKRTIWATADDDLRPAMTGVEFALSTGALDIVASNGHVLMKSEETVDYEGTCASFIMPKKVAKIVADTFQGFDQSADMMFTETLCTIEQGQLSIQFRCVDARYPNYDSIIPKSADHYVTADTATLMSAIRAVSPFTPDSTNMIRITFGDNGRIDVQGDDYDLDEGARKTLYGEGYNSPTAMTIGCKAGSVLNILQKMSCPTVVLSFSDPSRAVVVTPDEQPEGEEITGLFMPMLVGE